MNDNRFLPRRQVMKWLGGAAIAAALAPHGRLALAGTRPDASARAAAAAVKWTPGLQLYTLGLTPKDDLGAVLKQVAAIGYREVEFPGNYDKPAAQLRKWLDAANLTAPAAHIAPHATKGMWAFTDLPKFADDMKTIGATYAVVPIPYLPDRIQSVLDKPPAGFNEEAASTLFSTLQEDDWKRTADFLNEQGERLGKLGIRLAYHNHGMDFAPLGDSNGYRLLVERTDARVLDFELDIGWAVSAKQDLGALFALLGDRLKLLHLKDTKRPGHAVMDLASTDIGTGIVDWEAVRSLMAKSRIAHSFVEQETPFPTTPTDAVKNDIRFLSKLFAGEPT